MPTSISAPSVSPFNQLGNGVRPEDAQRLGERIGSQVPFYIRMQISPYEARVGRLLHAMVNGSRTPATPYHAFFCSSTSEAISGALKVVRHNHHLTASNTPHRTLVFDPSNSLKAIFDPFSGGMAEALVPGLDYCEDWAQFCKAMIERRAHCLLIRHSHTLSPLELSKVLAEAKAMGVLTILDESTTDLATMPPVAAQLTTAPDVIAFAENISNHRVPSGCILMQRDVYQVWNNVKDYNIHSNTWGGNSASLAIVLAFLTDTPAGKQLPANVNDELCAAADSHKASTKLYASYCSPKMATMLNISGLNKNIRTASKARIQVATRRGSQSIIDASGTYGVNLQGHNPQEVIADVIQQHDPDHDYWSDLQSLLRSKTGLDYIFPAVSGATSVEAVLTLGLLAAAPKKRVLALKGGFGGKSMLSLISTSRDRFKIPFGPLYPHVSYVDPFAADAISELEREVAKGDVAMVILETVQGEGGVRAIPQTYVDALQRLRDEHGFFIAIDEVQTGMYRTGKFLNHQGKFRQVDLVAMGKAMSENVFPVSGALVSKQVFQQAQQTNPELVERYANFYRCQFGAHVALHAVEAGERLGLASHAKEVGEHFLQGLRKVAQGLKFVKDVRGEGLMVGIEFEESKLPKILRGSFGGLVASHCVNDPQQPVLVAFNPDKPFLIRYVPPLCITKEEIDAVVATTERALRTSTLGLLKPIIVNSLNAKLGRY